MTFIFRKGCGDAPYKTKQYAKSPCYICAMMNKSNPTFKPPRVSCYCKTCNPTANRAFAICAPTSDRGCWELHQTLVREAAMRSIQVGHETLI